MATINLSTGRKVEAPFGADWLTDKEVIKVLKPLYVKPRQLRGLTGNNTPTLIDGGDNVRIEEISGYRRARRTEGGYMIFGWERVVY